MAEDGKLTRAQISRSALQRLSLAMRHLFVRGSYKPLGVSGESMISSMLELNPEIYGTIGDAEKLELNGMLYIFQRLPKGIEQCRYIKLISREGYETTDFEPLIPSKRRRNCYRIDDEQMYIEMTRGRSDIYDVLTHLTFMYIEAEKIRKNSLDAKNRKKRAWKMLTSMVQDIRSGKEINEEVGCTYLSAIIGRSFKETFEASKKFAADENVNPLIEIVYELGRLSMLEFFDDVDREISFSTTLRAKLGYHFFGEEWANQIKAVLWSKNLFDRQIHIVSANLHSVMNSLYAKQALNTKLKNKTLEQLATALSTSSANRKKVRDFAFANGMLEIDNPSGTNISVQIIDCAKIDVKDLPPELGGNVKVEKMKQTVIIVMDYAFGEQAYETMDELLKPYELGDNKHHLDVKSINIMGKAGILQGGKGDLMIPSSHIFEGSADNYPFVNDLSAADFEGHGLDVYEGSMITVLGTSLQNRDILRYFLKSSWQAIGLEMEGAHYQKAIQAASQIRQNVSSDVKLRYAYYASDNPLESGGTLASGSLGVDGVKPTYVITSKILARILE